jgi:hypothetical protein
MTKLKLTGWWFTGKIGQLINGNRVSVERFLKNKCWLVFGRYFWFQQNRT